MFGFLGLIGQGFSFLTGLAPAISSYLVNRQNVEAQEFATMTQAEQAEYIAYANATSALNAAKVANNASAVAHFMILAFGLPAALHWGAVYITATLHLGIAIDPLHGLYAEAEKEIALSFFIMAPALPVVSALTARLRG